MKRKSRTQIHETKLMSLPGLQLRKSARPNPIVRFFDIEKLLSFDDDILDTKTKANEFDDEEDPNLPWWTRFINESSFPLDNDEDINTAAEKSVSSSRMDQ